MYAGAARVAASLWKVDDAATAELRKLFYQKMLQVDLSLFCREASDNAFQRFLHLC
jgi:CHAT domain-containing protein